MDDNIIVIVLIALKKFKFYTHKKYILWQLINTPTFIQRLLKTMKHIEKLNIYWSPDTYHTRLFVAEFEKKAGGGVGVKVTYLFKVMQNNT